MKLQHRNICCLSNERWFVRQLRDRKIRDLSEIKSGGREHGESNMGRVYINFFRAQKLRFVGEVSSDV